MLNNLTKNKWIISTYLWFLVLPAFGQELASLSANHSPSVQYQSEQNITLESLLIAYEKKYQVSIIFNSDEIGKQKVTKPIDDSTLDRSLKGLLDPIGLTFKKIDEDVYVVKQDEKRQEVMEKVERSSAIVSVDLPSIRTNRVSSIQRPYKVEVAQTISGQVTDLSTDEPLPGVNILAKGTTTGTVTDLDGNYRLTVDDDVTTLLFSSIGFETVEETINGRSTIDISLAPDIQSLSEVVVVGYGTQKKRDLTGAVSSVKTRDVQRAVTTSAEEILQGRVAGVTVSQSSNAPGGGISVRVRGQSSISGGSDPLYVIDGIPIANSDQQSGNSPTGFRYGSNPSLSPLSQINPSDIESIEVLKDASATAIYGARGANGVVIITTKRGSAGKSTIELSSSYGVQEATRLPELLNAQQFVALNDEARLNDGRDLVFEGNAPPFDTNWQDELYRTAAVQNHSLAIRGGNERTTYALSFGYFDQQGVVRGSGLQRYSAKLNLEQQANDWLKVGINANISRTGQNLAERDVNRTINEMVPIGPVRIGDEWFRNTDMVVEDYMFGLQQANITPIDNSIFEAIAKKNETTTDRVLGSLFAEVSLAENLTFRTTVGADIANGRLYYFSPRTATQTNVALNRFFNSSHLSLQNQLTYQRAIGNGNLTATVVQSVEEFRQERLEALAEDISNVTENFNFNGDTRIENDKYPSARVWSIASFLGRVNYEYDGRYLLTGSLRYDGSSRFGADRRWGLFPAVSAGWVISGEDFFNSSSVSFLKLRAGWGVNGNQDIGTFRYLALTQGTRAVIGDVLFAGIQPSNLPNPELGWESTQQLNLGLDVGLLEDRFNLTTNLYDKLTSDLLFETVVPFTSGQEDITRNIGEVRNRGFEVELNGYVVDRGDFQWQTSFNYSYNDNEVLQLDGIVEEVINNNNNTILRPGLPINSSYGYLTDGLWQEGDDIANGPMPGAQPGDRRYVDVSGDTAVTAEDRVVLGASIPVHAYGWNNTFSYKGLSLSIFFQGLGGMEKYNEVMAATENTTGQENASTRVLDRWTPQNTNTQIQRAFQGGRQNVPPGAATNDYYVEDATFIRLKNVSLAYTLHAPIVVAG